MTTETICGYTAAADESRVMADREVCGDPAIPGLAFTAFRGTGMAERRTSCGRHSDLVRGMRANAQARGGAGYVPFETYMVEDALVDLYEGMMQGTEGPAASAWDDLPYVTGPVCYVCKSSIVTVEDRGGVCKQCRLDANFGGIM